jgi:DNA-binding NarL/FixJ family response regulator
MNSTRRLSIVHVDDDPIEITDVENDLGKGADNISFEVTSFRTTGEYRNYLTEGNQPDGVILDVHFKNETTTGLDLAKETKLVWPDTAVIIRTTDHHLVQDALTNGADDFIGKESFEGELCLRTIKTVNLVRERSGKEDQGVNIARGSAMECRATIDVCHILGLVSDVKKTQTKELLHRIVAPC